MAAKVEPYDDLDAVERAADGSLDRDSQPSLFDRLSWFRLIARHAPPPGRLLALRAEEAGEACWLFLSEAGGRAAAYANWYSLRFSACGRQDGGLLRAIAAHLKGRRPRLASVEAYPLAAGDPLPGAFRDAGWLVFEDPASTSWAIDTSGMDFETYWAARPSRLRNTAKRKAKAAALDIAVHTGFDPAAWADYEKVYAASWKGEEGSPAFFRALAEQ